MNIFLTSRRLRGKISKKGNLEDLERIPAKLGGVQENLISEK